MSRRSGLRRKSRVKREEVGFSRNIKSVGPGVSRRPIERSIAVDPFHATE